MDHASPPAMRLAAEPSAVAARARLQIDANELRIRCQHLTQLLRQTQETVRVQSQEISVLKKALVDYSSVALDDESSVVSSNALVSSLSLELSEAKSLVASLRAELTTKNTTIETLQRQLETTKFDLERVKYELEAPKESAEKEPGSTTVVNEMLAKSSRSMIVPPTRATRKKPKSETLFSHTISSKNKVESKPPSVTSAAKAAILNQPTNRGRTITMTAPHTFNPHPASSKHARSHSYDSYLKQLMASKTEYSHLHPTNISMIRNQAANSLNRSCEKERNEENFHQHEQQQQQQQHQRNTNASSKSFKSASKEFKVVTIQEHDFENNPDASSVHSSSSNSSGKMTSLLCDGLNDLRWLDLPSSNSSSSLPSRAVHGAAGFQYSQYIPSRGGAPTTTEKQSSNKQNQASATVPSNSKDKTLDILTARAVAAEMERDKLEEELLALMKKLNQQKEKDKLLKEREENEKRGDQLKTKSHQNQIKQMESC